MDKKFYYCRICKLHYEDRLIADKCYEWCSKNPSCNLSVARNSIEAKKAKMVI